MKTRLTSNNREVAQQPQPSVEEHDRREPNDRIGTYLQHLRRGQSRVEAGPNLARHRTQTEVAALAAVTPAYIGHLEEGWRRLPQKEESRANLAVAYGLTPDELEHVAAAYGEEVGRPGVKRGRPRKGERPVDPAWLQPIHRDTPFVELEWAYRTALHDPRFGRMAQLEAIVTTLEEKMYLVAIYENSTHRQLLSPTNRKALAILTNQSFANKTLRTTGSPLLGSSATTAFLLHELSHLLNAYKDAATIPKEAVLDAWAGLFIPPALDHPA